MSDRMHPPRRMRHSFEARCRVVALVEQGCSPPQAAIRCGVSRATAYRLVARYREGGWGALCDRPPIAKHHPARLSPDAEAQIIELRLARGWSARTIAAALGRPSATVHRVLRRHGLSRRERQPRPPANRYEHETVGALVHLDTKKLGRFWQPGKRVTGDGKCHNPRAGWQHVHVAVDDRSRYATTQIRRTDGKRDCIAFLDDLVYDYHQRAITIERLLTDNGSGYRSKDFAAACRRHGIRHKRTRPYTPRTNGKAEAFIRIMLREWAYAFIYPTSIHRARALPGWTRWYNTHRPHGSLGGHPPMTRLAVSQEAKLNS